MKTARAGSEQKRRDGARLFLVMIVVAAAVILVPLWQQDRHAGEMVRNEDQAVRMIRRVHDAEARFHAREGRYGWIEDLERAGLLEGVRVLREGDVFYAVSPGYRVDVLLPTARLGGSNVELTPQGGRKAVDFELSAEHFSVVARPLVPVETGWRSYYMDEADVLYTNEGVADNESARQNDLPRTQIKASELLHSSRPMLWQGPADLKKAE